MDRHSTIKLHNLSKKYNLYRSRKDRLKEALHPFRRQYHKDFWALRNVSLEVSRGTILGIVGCNGSGKSTLLKAVARVITPTEGHVTVTGRVTALLELGSSFNPQFTGMENIYFYGSISDLTRREIDAMVDDIVAFADIGEHIHQPLKTYSSGMKMRLAFAVSTVVEPEILILDEVLAVGDELFKRKCYARMDSLISEGVTVLFVSHSLDSINRICKEAILLERGELLLTGPAKMVTSYYQKMLYAPVEKREQVLSEIRDLQRNPARKRDFADTRKGETPAAGAESGEVRSTEELPLEEMPYDEAAPAVSEPYHVEGLKPVSTVEYRNYNVDIFDFTITTPAGKKVNHLIPGETYLYEYKVRYGMDPGNVVFGMQIKSDKGQVLMAVNSARLLKSEVLARKDDLILVKFRATINLLQGLYFLNAGVSLRESDGLTYLNRIVDACCFKVVPGADPASGLVFMNPDVDISVLAPSHDGK